MLFTQIPRDFPLNWANTISDKSLQVMSIWTFQMKFISIEIHGTHLKLSLVSCKARFFFCVHHSWLRTLLLSLIHILSISTGLIYIILANPVSNSVQKYIFVNSFLETSFKSIACILDVHLLGMLICIWIKTIKRRCKMKLKYM